jgi:hypothetical protein
MNECDTAELNKKEAGIELMGRVPISVTGGSWTCIISML